MTSTTQPDCSDLPQFVTGDRKPDMNARIPLLDETGEATGSYADLTGATVRFQMRKADDLAFTVDAAATIVTAAEGRVRYEWGTNDLLVPGIYQTQWEVTWSGGLPQTTRTSDICVRRA